MSKRKGGSRRKSRGELTKPIRMKGKFSIRYYLAKYKTGEQVMLKLDPTVNEGTFHARFIGKVGKVQGMRGDCYLVKINDMGKDKTMIVHPVHLRKN